MNWTTIRTIATYEEWQLSGNGDQVPRTCSVELQRSYTVTDKNQVVIGNTYRWFSAAAFPEAGTNEGAPSDDESEAWAEGLKYAYEQQLLF